MFKSVFMLSLRSDVTIHLQQPSTKAHNSQSKHKKRENKSSVMEGVPSKGIASDTWGKVSATKLRNTVNDSKMVTPATKHVLVALAWPYNPTGDR